MDREEAATLAEAVITGLRSESYDALVTRLLGEVETETMSGPSGSEYQVEVQALWDAREPGDLRVLVSVDDGAWSAFRPLTRDFLVASDGSFVGEPESHDD